MIKVLLILIGLITIFSCNDKRLDEKTIIGRDIKVSWYVISDITSSHEFVEVAKGREKHDLMKANQGSIDSVFIKSDTIFIKLKTAFETIYYLKKNAFGYKINCYF